MLKLKITGSTMEFKQMIKSISNISKYTLIEFRNNSTLFNTIHKQTNTLSVLHLAPSFFDQYFISRHIFLCVNVFELLEFLNGNVNGDDDNIHFSAEGQVPITDLDVCSHNIGMKKIMIKTLKVTELCAESWTYEPLHEFEVSIKPNLIKEVSQIAALKKRPSKLVTLMSGDEVFPQYSMETNDEYGVKNAPESMYYELQLPYVLARSFYMASHIATVVNIRDSYCSNIYRPILLEFSFNPFSRLLFYFKLPFSSG